MLMITKKTYIYRKELLGELGLDRNQVTPIVSRAQIFKSLPTGAGYAIQYDYRQVFLITLGCSLLSLGMKFNSVDFVLTDLQHTDWIDYADKIAKTEDRSYIVAITTLTPETQKRLKKEADTKPESELGGDRELYKALKAGEPALRVFIGTEMGLKHFSKQMIKDMPYIKIPLQPLLVRIHKVFGMSFYEPTG